MYNQNKKITPTHTAKGRMTNKGLRETDKRKQRAEMVNKYYN